MADIIMIKIEKNDINLYESITCGQMFRYSINDNKYILILDDRVVELYEDNKYIYIESSNNDNIEDKIISFLDLNRDYNEINNKLIKIDNSLKEVIELNKGFKIFRQYPFETMISYIISANNNVRNIQKAVNLLSQKYGEKIIFKENVYYLFPTLIKLKTLSLEDISLIKIGFRAKYVYNFIQNISNDDIEKIKTMNTIDAMNYLMTFNGIGLKVASCILMFSYGNFDVFPIDTWVKKYMLDNYGISDIKKIEQFAKDRYKEYSGLALQYFFHSKRNKQN